MTAGWMKPTLSHHGVGPCTSGRSVLPRNYLTRIQLCLPHFRLSSAARQRCSELWVKYGKILDILELESNRINISSDQSTQVVLAVINLELVAAQRIKPVSTEDRRGSGSPSSSRSSLDALQLGALWLVSPLNLPCGCKCDIKNIASETTKLAQHFQHCLTSSHLADSVYVQIMQW